MEIVQRLLRKGADANTKETIQLGDISGDHKLILLGNAASSSIIKIAETIMEYGTSGVEITVETIRTEANSGSVEMMDFLLEKRTYPMESQVGAKVSSSKGDHLSAEQRDAIFDRFLFCLRSCSRFVNAAGIHHYFPRAPISKS